MEEKITIYYLEMCDFDSFIPKEGTSLLETSLVDPPDPDLNRRYYSDVGAAWNWTDRLKWSASDWKVYVNRDELRTYVSSLNGEAVGYFELETQDHGNTELVYFGLLPDFIGRGLGAEMLTEAIRRAWEAPGTCRVWVHTCTDDHQHALENYRRRGFRLYRTESE